MSTTPTPTPPPTPSLDLDSDETLRADLRQFYDECVAAGITELHIGFFGSGDSGDLCGIDFVAPHGMEIPRSFNGRPEELAERVLHCHGGDYNNEGGQGTVQFKVSERIVHVDFEINVVETQDDSKAAAL